MAEHDAPAFVPEDEAPLHPISSVDYIPVTRKRDVGVMRMERRLLVLDSTLVFLAIADLFVRAGVVQDLPVISQLLRLDTFILVFLQVYALVRIGLHLSGQTRVIFQEEAFLGAMMHITGVALSLASIPVVFSEYSWVQFADLTMGNLYIPLLCFASINLFAVNVEVDVTARALYSWKLCAVCALVLLVYCIVVIIVNMATNNSVFPYTFVATSGHVKYWFFSLVAQIISIFNFVVTKYIVCPFVEKRAAAPKKLRQHVKEAIVASGGR